VRAPKRAEVIGVVCIVALALEGLAGWLLFDQWTCDQKWPDLEHRWVVGAGCQVMSEDGWIPDYRYRSFG
jgi:hypothetical protein